jgi:hypothetical protein
MLVIQKALVPVRIHQSKDRQHTDHKKVQKGKQLSTKLYTQN